MLSVALRHFDASIKRKRIFVCGLNRLRCYIHQNYLGWRWKAVTGVELAEWYEIMNGYFQPESDMVLQCDFTSRGSLVWFPDEPQGADFAFSPKVHQGSRWISFHSPKTWRLAWPFNSMLVRMCVFYGLCISTLRWTCDLSRMHPATTPVTAGIVLRPPRPRIG